MRESQTKKGTPLTQRTDSRTPKTTAYQQTQTYVYNYAASRWVELWVVHCTAVLVGAVLTANNMFFLRRGLRPDNRTNSRELDSTPRIFARNSTGKKKNGLDFQLGLTLPMHGEATLLAKPFNRTADRNYVVCYTEDFVSIRGRHGEKSVAGYICMSSLLYLANIKFFAL